MAPLFPASACVYSSGHSDAPPSTRIRQERNPTMLADRYGNDVSTYSQAALDRYNEALLLIRLYEGDPIAALDAALDDDPDFTMAWAARAAVLVHQDAKAYDAEAERSLRAGCASGGSVEERVHRAAEGAGGGGRP